jgi:hypothetical protein
MARYDPVNVKGILMSSHRASTARMVPNGSAPEDPTPIRKKLRREIAPKRNLNHKHG